MMKPEKSKEMALQYFKALKLSDAEVEDILAAVDRMHAAALEGRTSAKQARIKAEHDRYAIAMKVASAQRLVRTANEAAK